MQTAKTPPRELTGESGAAILSSEFFAWRRFENPRQVGALSGLTPRPWLIGEYKLTHSVQDVTVADGSARTPLTTHHVVVGTAVRLGVPRRVP